MNHLGTGATMRLPRPPCLFTMRRVLQAARASSSASSTPDAVAAVADAHGIERPGAAPFFDAKRGLGLAASSTAASSAVAARVPLSLCLSTDAALVSTGACGPPPAECLPTPQLRRLLPEAGCCPSVDDADAAWELRLGVLQLLMVGGRPSPPPLPPHHARCREFWSAWRASGALPARPASLLCWSESELALLGDDFLAAAARGWRGEARRVFDGHGVAALVHGDVKDEERAFEEYLWAVSAVASRAFAIEQEEEEEGEAGHAPGVVLGRAAVPFIDLANHGGAKGGEGIEGAAANCRVRLSPSGFVELVRCGDGGSDGRQQQHQQHQSEELLISYGVDKPSRSLMERYGFCPEGGCGSDRVDWREVAALAATAPPLARDELRRAVLQAGGAAPSPPPPLARAALAAAEARVLAGGSPVPFSAQHLARANKSVARLFGWRNAEEFRRLAQRGSGGDQAAAAAMIGRALASAAETARRRAEERAALVLSAGRNDVDADRAVLAAGYRGERGKMLTAVAALGEALVAASASQEA